MLQCGILGAGHLPVIFAIVFFFNLGCTYLMAVFHDDVEPVFPYISASGDHRPESCFFSLLLNITSCLSMLVIYIRYQLIESLIRDSDQQISNLNFVSLILGLLGGFGMMVVANFQETAVIMVHLIAACICFGSGCLYMIVQSYITIKMYPLYTNKRIGYIRTAITAVSTISFITAITFGKLAANKYHEYYPDLPTPRPWNRRMWMPGYNLHVISAIFEWIMAISHILFVLSYSRDFEKIRVECSAAMLVNHLDHSPIFHRSQEELSQ
ncbi:hypothetical protein WR25_16229 [Diploscapter pachys]|uniref:CWH43-like N-terminal domain-containing protein n=1 Tax=Diploscapter pachys TaxID=2018661 RepID=A0A2A2KN87_9BILA|nr:hypothetical protein WR25_16229 [Diploscapter pachys]